MRRALLVLLILAGATACRPGAKAGVPPPFPSSTPGKSLVTPLPAPAGSPQATPHSP